MPLKNRSKNARLAFIGKNQAFFQGANIYPTALQNRDFGGKEGQKRGKVKNNFAKGEKVAFKQYTFSKKYVIMKKQNYKFPFLLYKKGKERKKTGGR